MTYFVLDFHHYIQFSQKTLSFILLVNSLFSDLMSNTFLTVLKQDFGLFVKSHIWNFYGCLWIRCIFLAMFCWLTTFDKTFGHYEYFLYHSLSCMKCFPSFCLYHWLQWLSVVKSDANISVAPSQFLGNVSFFHRRLSYLIF